MSINWWDEMGRKGHARPEPPPPRTDWWSCLSDEQRRQWFENNADDLPFDVYRKMLGRAFETEAQALKFVQRSRQARRRSAQERQASAQKAATTRMAKERERRQADQVQTIRQSCRIWDDQHSGDAAVRAGQANELKRHTRQATSRAIESKALRADWHYGIGGLTVLCQRCRQIGTRIEAHHGEYSDPIAVSWICPYCHGVVHFDEQPPNYWARTIGARIAAAAIAERLPRRELGSLAVDEGRHLAFWAGRQIAIRGDNLAESDAASRVSEAISAQLAQTHNG